MLTRARFCSWHAYEDGRLARLALNLADAPEALPLYVFADDGSDFSLAEGDACEFELYGQGQGVSFYSTAADYEKSPAAAATHMASEALIPIGAFPPSPGAPGFRPGPEALFTGPVLTVANDPAPAPGAPNWLTTIGLLGFSFGVYLRHDGPVAPGQTAHGTAWLYAIIRKAGAGEKET